MPNLLVPDIQADTRDGVVYLRSRVPLAPPPRTLGALLEAGARTHPERTLFAERAADGAIHRRTWGEVWQRARGIAAHLVRRGVTDPIAVLSGNRIAHAELLFGGMIAGVPVAPLSEAYSLRSQDHQRLREVVEQLRPSTVFVQEEAPFLDALRAADLLEVPRYTAAGLDGLAATPVDDACEAAFARVGPDTVAKILFTSGSTGHPKGVPTTQRMLCVNQQMIAQCWPFLADTAPVLLDWLPWSHTFGGSHNLGMVLMHGGTLFIDEGRPTPTSIERTVRNIVDMPPTDYFTVPAGYAALIPRLEDDPGLAERFFSRLRTAFYAGAALPDDLWQRLAALAERAGREVFITTAWGSTETSPLSTSAHFPLEGAGNIGVPAPGVELKLVPTDRTFEIRVRGPHVFAGYLGADAPDSFDEEGYYRIGDAVQLVDPQRPEAGLLFDGRVSENFKLDTGTWVTVGPLRLALLDACAPALLDLVICGEGGDRLGILAWPSPAGVARLGEDLRQHVHDALVAFAKARGGRSASVHRALLLQEPPSIDAGEITDKGYVNQRAVLRRRSPQVERLFAESPDEDVIVVGASLT